MPVPQVEAQLFSALTQESESIHLDGFTISFSKQFQESRETGKWPDLGSLVGWSSGMRFAYHGNLGWGRG